MLCKWTTRLLSLEHEKKEVRVEQYQNRSDPRFISEAKNGQHFPLNTCHQWSTGRKNDMKLKEPLKYPILQHMPLFMTV